MQTHLQALRLELQAALLHDLVVAEDELLIVAVNDVEFFEFVYNDSFECEYQIKLVPFFVFAVNVANVDPFEP